MRITFRIFLYLTIIISFRNYYAQDETGSFQFDGHTRKYEVYLPQNFQPNMPVVISLHGYTETIQWYKDYTLLHQFADTSGFITVYPGAIGASWNSGLIAPGWPTIDTTVNDVGFISVLIDRLKARYDIDLSRVYCCGFSLGGEMTYRLAIELGNRFAAFASITGLINEVSGNLGNPIRPLPILHMHGTRDNYETWNGDNKNLWTVPETIDFWLENNDCGLQTDSVSLPDLNPNDGSTVEKISYTNCADETSFIFYKINKGGHSWPGSAFSWSGEGSKNMDINANVEIWNFFKNYTNPLVNANMAYGKSLELHPKYIRPNGDTLIVNAQLSNPEDHIIKVYAIVKGDEHNFQDSIELFDDGLHGDGEASDNIWGEKWVLSLQEDTYTVDLSITDLTIGDTYSQLFLTHFTTNGPVTFENYEIISSTTLPNNAERKRFSLCLRNDGITDSVYDVTVNIILPDNPFITNSTTGFPKFGDIAPGSLSNSSRDFALTFSDSCLPGTYEFGLEITSNDIVYWYDTFTIDVVTGIEDGLQNLPKEFALEQNYPNPFNPATTIKYSIPRTSRQYSVDSRQHQESSIQHQNIVTLKVYDVLGKEVAILVNEQQRPGYYEVKWDASALTSGVYFYKLTAGSFAETKKMLLLK